MPAALPPALVPRLAAELIRMLVTVVSDAGYDEDEPAGVPLMVRVTATVLACMLQEDGDVAAADVNAALAAYGLKYRLVAMN